jgi:hypothetical protein
MPNGPLPKFRIFEFTVAKVFPPDNMLAVDILRLMASCNDMAQIADWIAASAGLNPCNEGQVIKKLINLAIPRRLLLGVLHEAFYIFDNIQGREQFKRVRKHLRPQGETALKNLRLEAGRSTRTKLARARNRLIFHYDAADFIEAIRRYTSMFAEKELVKGRSLVEERNPRAYYLLPEHLRDIIAFDFKPGDTSVKDKLASMHEVRRLQREMHVFVDELFRAYLKGQGLEAELRELNTRGLS